MRDIVLTAIVLGVIPFAITRPHWGVLLWTWISVMSPHRLTWGFAYDLPFALVAAIVTLLSIFITREKFRFPWTGTTIVLVLFIAWTSFTTLFAIDPDAGEQWKKVLKIQFFTLITFYVMQTKERIIALVWVCALSLGYFGFKGGIYTLTGGSGLVLGPVGSFIEGNNEIALAMTMAIPLVHWAYLQSTQWWIRLVLMLTSALSAVAIIGSYSRGGLLAILGMAGFLWLKSPNKLVTGVVVACVAAVAAVTMPAKWFEKMYTIQTYQEDGSAQGRFNAWAFARNLAADRPIVGGGFEVFGNEAAYRRWAPIPENHHDAHSIWFEVLGEHGYVGLILFVVLLILAWRTGTQISRLTRDRPELLWANQLGKMVQVSLIGYMVGGSFLGLAYWDFPYILIAILVLTKAVLVKEHAAPVAAADAPESFSSGMAGPVEPRGAQRATP